jgi:acyl-CoA synthetase (AMP-forming)/AMP-acid ligase II
VDGVQAISFGEWERRATSVAHGLLELGCAPGDRVALLFSAGDWIEYAIAYIAALRVGAAVVHVSPRLPFTELERRFRQCNVSTVVHSPGLEYPAVARESTVAALDRGLDQLLAVSVNSTDVADIGYTSGTTTGVAKPVLITHGDHLSHRDPRKRREFEGSRYFLGPFPVGTGSSQGMVMFALSGAATVLVLSRFDPAHICERIQTLAVDNVMMTPGTAIELTNFDQAGDYDLSSVRVLASGSSVLGPAIAKRLCVMFPNAKIMQYYASMESIPAMTVCIFDPARPDTVGRPNAGTELKIADERGVPVPTGEVGEIWLRSAHHRRRYVGDAELNAGVFVDGWIRMGDLGHTDGEGHLYLFDRSADAIRSRLGVVSTIRVESAMYEHPGVREACVVGVPDPELGQVVAAAVVLRPSTTLAELRGFLEQRLNPHELPARFVVDRTLARGLIGKVLKREVRKWFVESSTHENGPNSQQLW